VPSKEYTPSSTKLPKIQALLIPKVRRQFAEFLLGSSPSLLVHLALVHLSWFGTIHFTLVLSLGKPRHLSLLYTPEFPWAVSLPSKGSNTEIPQENRGRVVTHHLQLSPSA